MHPTMLPIRTSRPWHHQRGGEEAFIMHDMATERLGRQAGPPRRLVSLDWNLHHDHDQRMLSASFLSLQSLKQRLLSHQSLTPLLLSPGLPPFVSSASFPLPTAQGLASKGSP